LVFLRASLTLIVIGPPSKNINPTMSTRKFRIWAPGINLLGKSNNMDEFLHPTIQNAFLGRLIWWIHPDINLLGKSNTIMGEFYIPTIQNAFLGWLIWWIHYV
jgi:hypothetical protein